VILWFLFKFPVFWTNNNYFFIATKIINFTVVIPISMNFFRLFSKTLFCFSLFLILFNYAAKLSKIIDISKCLLFFIPFVKLFFLFSYKSCQFTNIHMSIKTLCHLFFYIVRIIRINIVSFSRIFNSF